MIDAAETVSRILAAALVPDRVAAERAVSALLAQLRAQVQAMPVEMDRPPMLRTWNPEPPSPGEVVALTVRRLSARLEEMRLAKRFGDATDVQQLLDLTLRELRTAALGRMP